MHVFARRWEYVLAMTGAANGGTHGVGGVNCQGSFIELAAGFLLTVGHSE